MVYLASWQTAGAPIIAGENGGRVDAGGVADGRVAVFVFHVRHQGIRAEAGDG